MNTVQVTTPCGVVEGFKNDGISYFLGIPYATAERFAYPKEVTSWEGIFRAQQYGPAPIQERAYVSVDASDPKNHYEHEFYQNIETKYSEDCLNLNIWAPENAENCPILVIIYGGGLVSGQNNSGECNGEYLARRGIITVAMNYRVNVFGFIAMKELEDENGKSGNYGYYDQQTAISWIRRNIQSFGGDPNNMTLIGQSAGAASCETQIKSPLNKGVFKRAVIQSSAGFSTFIKQKKDNAKEYEKWHKVYEKTGCRSIEEFKKLPAKALYDAYAEVSSKQPIGFVTAVYDENFTSEIKNQPCPVKIMCSLTSEDVMPFILFIMCKYLVRSQSKRGLDTYAYYFRRQLPGDDKGAWHGSELPYLYGSLEDSWRPFEEEDHAPLLKEWCDMLLFLNYKTYVVTSETNSKKAQGGKRVMYTSHHPCWDAKNRHGLPPEMEMNFDGIAHLFKKSSKSVPADSQAKAVAQLRTMITESGITEADLQKVVASKGHYSADTPIDNYSEKFITGWCLKYFGHIINMITEGN